MKLLAVKYKNKNAKLSEAFAVQRQSKPSTQRDQEQHRATLKPQLGIGRFENVAHWKNLCISVFQEQTGKSAKKYRDLAFTISL